jgi:hypothetical protein
MTTEKTVQELTDEFYSKPLFLSYSGLNKLLYSPSLYYKHYVLQEKEDKLESYLIDGKVIHCLLLDDGSFDQQFMLMPSALPGDSLRKIVDKVMTIHLDTKGLDVPLDVYSQEILTILKETPLHQALADDKKAPFKTGDEKRLEKILTDDAKSYFEFLKLKGNKDLIDNDTLQRCNESIDALKLNEDVCHLLGISRNDLENVDVYNEKLLTAQTDKPFGLKGVLDNVKIDHDAQIIFVNDLKTTGKTIVDFRETIEFYNYWAQAAIYERLAAYEFSELIMNNYRIVFNFVVIDKYLQVYVFEVSRGTLDLWQLKLEEKLKEATWHYEEKNFKLPYEFAKSKVIL